MSRLHMPLLPRWLRWAGVLGVAVTIGYFSLFTTPPSTPQPGPFWDKKLHFIAYGTFTLALAYATASMAGRPWARILLVVAGSILFGVAIELIQWVLPARFFSVGDMLANAFGTILATAWFLIEPRIEYQAVARQPGTDDT